MNEQIVAVGNQDFTFGFEIAGLKAFSEDEFSYAISKEVEAGIVILDEAVYEKLSQREKQQVTTMTKPLVVILSQNDTKGSNLREMIIKSLGVDLLKDK
jgi:vacuolar-type H+-ATPase subunit F/Vma7